MTATPRVPYDRRAIHRVVSDPSVLDIANDCDADAQEAIAHLWNANYLALGTGNGTLVDEINAAGKKLQDIRERIHFGLDLLRESARVDPYRITFLEAA